MVYIARLPGLLSLTALVTIFLSALAESKMECKGSSNNTVFSTDQKEDVIVVLNSDDDAAHKTWLKDCWGFETMSVHDDNYPSDGSELKNVASFFSVKGTKLQGYSGAFSTEFIKTQVSKRIDVKYVEKNGVMKISYAVPSRDELFKRTTDSNKPLFNLDRIDQAKYPVDGNYTYPDSAGKGVNIFVLDTGVDTKHVEFEGRAKLLVTFCSEKGGCTGEDGNGHGSHVSGTAAGKTVGVARQANILGIRVIDDDGEGENTNVIKGMSFALNRHMKSENKNSVVSMSLGGDFSQAINDAVKSLTDGGVHVVVAAGNDGTDACKSSPSSELSANTVGAIEDTKDEITDFSDIGKCVDIFAPGLNIVSVAANTKNKFETLSGTSQATPHVSGTIALIIAQSGNLSPAKMSEKLIDLSTKGVLNVTEEAKHQGTPNRVLRVPAP